jgi:hypothetical protein
LVPHYLIETLSKARAQQPPPLIRRDVFKQSRATALAEWRQLVA